MRPQVRQSRRALVAMTSAVAIVLAAVCSADDLATTYQEIKDIESKYEKTYPLPPSVVQRVGKFDIGTGTFDGPKVEHRIVTNPTTGKPMPRTIVPELEIDGVNVALTFEISSAATPFWVRANGKRVDAAPHQTSLTIDVGKASDVSWEMRAGRKKYLNKLKIVRPLIIGVGAFTIPYMPVTIIYAPPPGRLGQNQSTYKETRTLGASYEISFSSERSETSDPISGNPLYNMNETLERALVMAGKLAFGSDAMNQALKLFSQAFGSYTTSTTMGSGLTDESGTSLVLTESSEYGTPAGKGPGEGDRILFLRNAKMVWLSMGDTVSLALLGAEGNAPQAFTVVELRQRLADPKLSLVDREGIEALIRLDPLASSTPPRRLPSPRYSYVKTILDGETSPEGDITGISHEEIQTTSGAQSRFKTEATDFNDGWLSGVMFRDPPANITTTVSNSRRRDDLSSSETWCELRMVRQEGEFIPIDVYFDNVFGTLAFVDTPEDEVKHVVSGTMPRRPGGQIGRTLVTFTQNGRKIETYTDASGRYSIRKATPSTAGSKVRFGKQVAKTVGASQPVKVAPIDQSRAPR